MNQRTAALIGACALVFGAVKAHGRLEERVDALKQSVDSRAAVVATIPELAAEIRGLRRDVNRLIYAIHANSGGGTKESDDPS